MGKKVKKIIKLTLLLLLAFLLINVAVLVNKGYLMYKEAVKRESLESKVKKIQKKKDYTRFEDLPEIYVNAILAVEDEDFFTNNGFNMKAIRKAVITDIKERKFVEGGSSITQQLAKNLFFTLDKTMERKVAEVFVVRDINRNYDKKTIFELYVNSIYFGNNYYSVASASKGYFNKKPKDMTDCEATMLAGIPNAPSVYAPNINPDLARKRHIQVIKEMIEKNFIDNKKGKKLLANCQ